MRLFDPTSKVMHRSIGAAVLLAFGSYLTWKYRAWGFVMITALVGATFSRQLGIEIVHGLQRRGQ